MYLGRSRIHALAALFPVRDRGVGVAGMCWGLGFRAGSTTYLLCALGQNT